MIWALFPVASAHIRMNAPSPVTTEQKVGPCGDGPHARTGNVAVFAPGETITVEWEETINHPSTFRIAFDDDGDDAFADPQTLTDFYTNAAVLLDDIPDDPGRRYSVQVTLPSVECEACTLQLIQVMHDKPPYAPGTNDIYYQCADLALRDPGATGAHTGGVTNGDTGEADTGEADTDTDTDADTDTDTDTDTDADADTGSATTDPTDADPDDGSGCGCGHTSPGALAWLLAAPLAALARRRSARPTW